MRIKTRRSLSFAGCGFLGIYHVGVAVCFRQHAPQLLMEKIAGVSGGALAACCLLCDLPLESMAGDYLRIVQETRRHSLGAISPWFSLPECLLEGMQNCLPPDAHRRVSGRLHISLTRISDRQNVVISEFRSRQELIQALLCSSFIPGVSGLVPPQFRGVRYMDGAFSNNLPLLDEHTVTVSPFCGESDICPRDQSSHRLKVNINWSNTCVRVSRRNICRLVGVLFPGRSEFIANFCQQGYDDALLFLRRNRLLKEGYKVQEGDMVRWIQQQEEIEAKRVQMKSCHEKELDSDHQHIRQKQEVKDTGQNDEKNRMLVPENRRHCYAISLMRSTWSLLRRVLTPPQLAMHVVQMIAEYLSRSFTLLKQPHFDLALMHAAAGPPPPALGSTSCPPSTPLGIDNGGDKSKVKAKPMCDAGRLAIELGDQVAKAEEEEAEDKEEGPMRRQ